MYMFLVEILPFICMTVYDICRVELCPYSLKTIMAYVYLNYSTRVESNEPGSGHSCD